jgi:hypothetical protein
VIHGPKDVVGIGIGGRGQRPISPAQRSVQGSSFVKPSLIQLRQGASKRGWLGLPGDQLRDKFVGGHLEARSVREER